MSQWHFLKDFSLLCSIAAKAAGWFFSRDDISHISSQTLKNIKKKNWYAHWSKLLPEMWHIYQKKLYSWVGIFGYIPR